MEQEPTPEEADDALRRLAEALGVDTLASDWRETAMQRVSDFGGDMVLRPDGRVEPGSVMDGEEPLG
jgi:hypothetical protein